MSTPIVAFSPEHLPALVSFCEQTWQRPRTAAYYRWRYLESPLQRGWLILRDDAVIAMLLAFARPYRCGAETVTFLEVHDWYALPDLKGAGLGVRLIRHAMSQPEPVLMVGGSADSRKLMPRLGYGAPVNVERWTLPGASGPLADALRRRRPALGPLARVAGEVGLRTWFRTRHVRPPPGGRVVPVACPGGELDALYASEAGAGTVPLWPKEHLAWLLSGFAGAGHFVPLYFAIGEKLRGFALGRVVETEQGCEATIVHVFAPQADVALYTWMLSELVAALAAFRPNWIHAGVSCPQLSAALRSLHFLRGGEDPVWVWPRDRALPEPATIALDTGDVPLLPYPKHWWGALRKDGDE